MYQQPQAMVPVMSHPQKHRDGRLIGAYIVAGFGLAFGIACLVLMGFARNIYLHQMSQMHRSISQEQTERTNGVQNMNGRISKIADVLGPLAQFGIVCSTDLEGPAGPARYYFACTSTRVGS